MESRVWWLVFKMVWFKEQQNTTDFEEINISPEQSSFHDVLTISSLIQSPTYLPTNQTEEHCGMLKKKSKICKKYTSLFNGTHFFVIEYIPALSNLYFLKINKFAIEVAHLLSIIKSQRLLTLNTPVPI